MHNIISRSEAKSLGLKSYFTGKPCKHGHVSKRSTINGTCITCSLSHPCRKTEEYKRKKKISDSEYAKANRDKCNLANHRYREKNIDNIREKSREFSRKYRSENKEKVLVATRIWKSNNKEKTNEYQRNYSKKYRKTDKVRLSRRDEVNKRNAKKRMAMPSWANLNEIKKVYLSCPSGFHVDHIIPLRSKIVCGLHCEQNLQHLPAKENIRKGNKFWPDMP